MADDIFVFCNGKKSGPYGHDDILRLLADHEIDMTAKIKENGIWTDAHMLPWIYEAGEPESPCRPSSPVQEYRFEQTVVCPHCWYKFSLSEVNYISKHLDLAGDSVLGPEAQQRFLPTVFNEQGYAIDAKGLVCQEMACPHCHLKIPEAVIDIPSSLFSIVGAPASGKSYYLTAMVWQLRNILSKQFDYTLSDTDATFNSILNSYEQILFLNRQTDEYVALPKTELQGSNFSDQIMLKGLSIDLPLPFIFTLNPMVSNKNSNALRNLILYDNAGEHFEPGRDQVTNLATQHLIHSEGIIFLYDPIKDIRMVTQCNPQDPQVAQVNRGSNQLVLLNEMIARIRKYAGLNSREKYSRPLIVVIPKYDAWKDSFCVDLEEYPFTYYSEREMSYSLNLGNVINVSYMMREYLMRVSPEVVATCESFFSKVYFLPNSALGRMPEYDASKNMIVIKPSRLKPVWAEVPMLLLLWLSGLIDGVDAVTSQAVPVENYKFTGDSLICVFPGIRERQVIPAVYWGRTVYHPQLGRYFKLPDRPSAEDKQDGMPESDDSGFWQQ